jgi:tetratricopeptide (TPR) repeat protein
MAVWQRLRHSPVLAAVLLLTAGLYVQVWQHTLIWDEHTLTTQQVISHPSWANYQRSFQETYRPLVMISVMIDHLIWRGWPPGYAVDSLAYHLLVVVLLFALARQWLTPFPAITAALIAALHPVGAETVSYLLGRPDLLSAACLIAALLVFMNIEHPDRRTLRLVLFWCLGLLALAAKETALLLPFLAVCVVSHSSNDDGNRWEGMRRRMLAVGPFVVLFGLYATARVFGGGERASTVLPLSIHFTADTLALMAATSAIALKALVWPVDLCPWYEGQNVVPASAGTAAGLLLLVLTGAAVTVWSLRRHAPAVSLGLAWITGIVGLIAIRAAVSPAPMNPLAVRWLYPAMLGLAMIVGGCMQRVETEWPRASRLFILGLLTLFALATWQTQSRWQNDLALFQRAVGCNPRSAFITLQYIDILSTAGKQDQADRLFHQLQTEQPENSMVLSRLIRQAIDRGDYHTAIDRSRELIRVAPSFLAFRTLGELLTLTNQPEAAIDDYRTALRLQPGDMLSVIGLGNLYEQTHRWDEAAALYRDDLIRHPHAANLWFRLGRTSEKAGHLQEAASAFEATIQFDEYCPDGYLAQARIQRQLGNTSLASDALKRYTDLTHQTPTPRPTTDPLDAPCGLEPRIIYSKKTDATALLPGPARQATP